MEYKIESVVENHETYELKTWQNGDIEWFQNGKWHRLDGPALEYTDGTKSYWIEGVKYSYEDWKRKLPMVMFMQDVNRVMSYYVKNFKKIKELDLKYQKMRREKAEENSNKILFERSESDPSCGNCFYLKRPGNECDRYPLPCKWKNKYSKPTNQGI